MVALRSVAAAVVRPAHARRVVGPSYDALRPSERRRLADDDPDSFFNVVRSVLDYGDDPVPADLLATNAVALERLFTAGRYEQHEPDLFIYRLSARGRTQTAVVGDLPLSDHRSGRILPHEQTRTTKEAELARHLLHVGVNFSPVGLGYRSDVAIAEVVAVVTSSRPPLVDFDTADGVRQQVWAVADPRARAELTELFDAVDVAYILDGHHRVAAAAAVHPHGSFLAALIPDAELHLLPYHRLVQGPLHRPVAALAAAGEPAYRAVVSLAAPLLAPGEGRFGLYAQGRWYRLDRREPIGKAIPAAVADTELLGPLFDITDARTDPRLDFVPGGAPPSRLTALVDEGQGAAITLAAPTVAQVFDEVDAGRLLPPKSTWFEPKLRSGIFLVRR